MKLSDLKILSGSAAAEALPEVLRTIRTLRSHGFLPVGVHDGEDMVPVNNEGSMVSAVFAVDEAMAYFQRATGGQRQWVRIILMNGADAISDYSAGDVGFDRAMQESEDAVL